MRTRFLTLSLMLTAFLVMPRSAEAGGGIGITFGAFYSSLGPYGEWIGIGAGTYAWHPAGMAVGWRPYTLGHWAWTDDGWYWVSDEPWGWACFHYGRWYYDDFYGWLWVPGYDWSPAWVEWRYGDGCVGWAPLSPYAVFRAGVGIYYRHSWRTPYSYWSFVNSRYIGSSDLHRYVYRSGDNTRLIGRTRGAGSVRVEGGRIITRGPDRTYVERTGDVRINRAEIVDMDRRGNARVNRSEGVERIEAYRPRVEARAQGPAERPERLRESSQAPSIDVQRTDIGTRAPGATRSQVRAAEPARPQPQRAAPAGRGAATREQTRQAEPARPQQPTAAPRQSGERRGTERRAAPSSGQSDRPAREPARNGGERRSSGGRRMEQMPARSQSAAVGGSGSQARAPRYEPRSRHPERTVWRPEPRREDGRRRR